MTPRFAPVPALRDQLVTEVQLAGLRISESHHAPSSAIARHAHRSATLTLLVAGSFEEQYRLRPSVSCFAPAVHVRPQGEAHQDLMGAQGARNVVVEIDDRRLDAMRPCGAVFDDVKQLKSPRVVSTALRIGRELRIRDEASALSLEGLVLELMGAATRESAAVERAAPSWIGRVRELLHTRYLERGLGLDALAAEAGLHPVHFCRVFRQHLGASPGEYVRQLRLQWAADELRTTHRSIAEIAWSAGFTDQSHLTRLFRAQLGWTPAAWRRGCRPVD